MLEGRMGKGGVMGEEIDRVIKVKLGEVRNTYESLYSHINHMERTLTKTQDYDLDLVTQIIFMDVFAATYQLSRIRELLHKRGIDPKKIEEANRRVNNAITGFSLILIHADNIEKSIRNNMKESADELLTEIKQEYRNLEREINALHKLIGI